MKGEGPALAIMAVADCARYMAVIDCGHVQLITTVNPCNLPPDHQDRHAFFEFLIPLSSIPQLSVEDQDIDCLPGNIIPINPGLRHGVRPGRKAAAFVLILIESAHLDSLIRQVSLDKKCQGFPVESFPLKSDIQRLVTRLIFEERERSVGRDLLMRCLADELAILLIRHYYQPVSPPELSLPDHLTMEQFRFRKAITFMQDHYNAQMSVDRLARMTGMNSCHFIRSFRKYFDISPYNYLTRIRLANAKRLLIQTCLPAAQIGEQCGFRSASRFSAVFLKDTGLTPSRFRKANQR